MSDDHVSAESIQRHARSSLRKWLFLGVFAFAFSSLYILWLNYVAATMGFELLSLLREGKGSMSQDSFAVLVKIFGAPAFVGILVLAVLDSFLRVLKRNDGSICPREGIWVERVHCIGATFKLLCILALFACAIFVACIGQVETVSEAVILIAMLV